MPLNIPTFLTRTGSAIVFAAIMLTGLLWNEWTYFALIVLIHFFCINDYFRLAKKIELEANWSVWFIIASQILGLLFITILLMGNNSHYSFLLLFISPLMACVPATIILLTAGGSEKNITPVLFSFGAVLYISLPLGLFISLRAIDHFIPLGLVLLIWVNDTMAYISGSFFGRTPFSAASPKKTWEGTIGGIVCTMLIAILFTYFKKGLHIQDWIILALCASVAGTAGDLFESKLKRLAGVKDSGNLMPGHGGALDRFDSLLVAIPFAFFYAYFFMEKFTFAP